MKFNGKAYEQLYPRQKPVLADEVPVEDKMVVEQSVEEEAKTPEVLVDGTAGTDEHISE